MRAFLIFKSLILLVFIIFQFIVILGCGSRTSENSTYFQSSNSPTSGKISKFLKDKYFFKLLFFSKHLGSCGVTICRCSPDICQVKFSFKSDFSEIIYNILHLELK